MSATDGKDRPKTYSLADAVKEVKYWLGVNVLRFTYDRESMKRLFEVCCEFEKVNKERLEL